MLILYIDMTKRNTFCSKTDSELAQRPRCFWCFVCDASV